MGSSPTGPSKIKYLALGVRYFYFTGVAESFQMGKFIDELDLPPGYEKVVAEHGNNLRDLVGVFGDGLVMLGSEAVTNPSTGETIEYSEYIYVNPFCLHDDPIKDSYWRDGAHLVERERRTAIKDLGFAGIKAGLLTGVALPLINNFNALDAAEMSVAGGVGGVVLLGAFSLRQRHRRRRDFKNFVETLSGQVSLHSDLKTRIGCNLFAPDSVVYDDAATGTLDNRQSSNNYFIGSVPIDQESRAKHFWQEANETLKKAGFEEWQSEKPSMAALVKHVLEGEQEKPYFNDAGMGDIVAAVHYFSVRREEQICEVQKINELLKIVEARQKNGVGIADINVDSNFQIKILASVGGAPQDLENAVVEVLEEIDKKHTEYFQNFVKELRHVIVYAKALYNEGVLLKTYKCYSEIQKLFWEELSMVLAENNIDPLYLDETSLEMVQFISQIPEMCATNEGALSDNLGDICELYRSFHKRFSVEISAMSPPEFFIGQVFIKRDRERPN